MNATAKITAGLLLLQGCSGSSDTVGEDDTAGGGAIAGAPEGSVAGRTGSGGHAGTGGSAGMGGSSGKGGSAAGGATGTGGTGMGGKGAAGSSGAFGGVPSDAGAGVWEDVTPRGLTLTNFGVQDVVVDPVRPTDLYAFTCFQGVYKSVDYGATWTGPINTGTGGAMIDSGKAWSAGVDSSQRDPSTPPTLWAAIGDSGSATGALKSTDGGVSWKSYSTHNTTAATAANNPIFGESPYSIDVDPYDGEHLLTGFHGEPGISESLDGGVTWTTIAVSANGGSSVYPFFIEMGDAQRTRSTWVGVPQDGGGNGTWRTTDAGSTWTQVAQIQHGHGNSQLWNVGNGVAYVGATDGIYKTTDGGATWTKVSSTMATNVVATATTLYAAWGYDQDPRLQTAARGADTKWTMVTAPAGMNKGWKRAAVTYDGTHYIVVSGSWTAGIWRYVEP
jgi:hypothetical protein